MKQSIYPLLALLVFCASLFPSSVKARQTQIPDTASSLVNQEKLVPPEIKSNSVHHPPHYHYKKIMKLIAQLKFVEAIAVSDKLTEIYTNNPTGYPDKAAIDKIDTFLLNICNTKRKIKLGEYKLAFRSLMRAQKRIITTEMEQAVVKMKTLLEFKKKKPSLDDLHKLYANGVQSLTKKHWLEAISYFTKVNIINPDFMQVKEELKKSRVGHYLQQGSQLAKRNRIKEAMEMFRSVLEIDPENPEATRSLSLLTEKEKQKNIAPRQTPDNRRTKNREEKYIWETYSIESEDMRAPIAPTKSTLSSKFNPRMMINYILLNRQNITYIAIGIVGVVFVFLLVFRFGKIREHYQKVKKLNNNRLLYEKILENSPKRRALYSSLASIYKQLEMDSKLPWLQEMCYEQQNSASTTEAPLWQLCLGEIYWEFEDLEAALREMEQAWDMNPYQEEIKQKLKKLYRLLLERDPENPVWESGIQRISSLQKAKNSLQQEEKKEIAAERKKTPPSPNRQKTPAAQPEKTQDTNKQIASETLGGKKQRPSPLKRDTSPTQPSSSAESEKEEVKTTSIFSEEKQQAAYEEIFGHRKKDSRT